MGNREKTTSLIIHNTIDFINKYGVQSLSMRKIAECTGISLSNLQYYYKTQEDLLLVVIKTFFSECENQILSKIPEGEITDEIYNTFFRNILENFLVFDDSHQLLTMFKEIWALSSRDEKIRNAVNEYYSHYVSRVIEIAAKHTSYPIEVISLIIPFVEGYTIMGNTLPLNKEQVIDLLMHVIKTGIQSKRI